MFSSLRSRSKRLPEPDAVGAPNKCQSPVRRPSTGKYDQELRISRQEDGVRSLNHGSQKCSSLKPACLTSHPRQGSLDKALCQGKREKAMREIQDNSLESCHHKDTMADAWPEEFEDGVEGTTMRVVGVSLMRSDQGLGITLRGGRFRGGQFHPLTITHIKPNGPADKEGTIKVGDRLLAVDGQPLTGLSLTEAQEVLREGSPGGLTWLTVEYDVSVMSRLRTSGPLLVEIDSPNQPHNLGLSLIDSRGRVIVSKVHTATISERCGALLPGDQILAVNEYRIENSKFTAKDVTKILNNFKGPLLQIEILPVPSITMRGNTTHRTCPPSPTLSAISASSKHYQIDNCMFGDRQNFQSAVQPLITNMVQDKCTDLRIENGVVTLHCSPGQGFGLKLRWVPSKMAAVICDIEPNSVADRSGVLQIGDRITSVNGQGPAECSCLDTLGTTTVVLTVQFDVECHHNTDSTVSIRLTRSANSGFGITINGCTEYPSSIVISNIRWGSVAHRCGQLCVGDQLIAINDQHIGGDIHLATEILQQCGRLVSFVIVKQGANLDLGYSSPGLPSIVDSAIESWDSSEQNPPIADFHRQPITSELQEDWRSRINQSCNSIITQQSEDNEEDTCSSYRLSESVLDVIASGEHRIPVHKAPSPPCPLQTNYKARNINMSNHWRGSSINNSNALNNLEALETELNLVAAQQNCPKTFKTFRGGLREDGGMGTPPMPLKNCFQVTLRKDPIYEDFGFSVSDGLYERGVFINRIRPGGPADISRMLQPFDRIIQVNDTKTDDFDCCLTVPLVASAGNTVTLTMLRQIDDRRLDIKDLKSNFTWVKEVNEEVNEPVETPGHSNMQFAQTL